MRLARMLWRSTGFVCCLDSATQIMASNAHVPDIRAPCSLHRCRSAESGLDLERYEARFLGEA